MKRAEFCTLFDYQYLTRGLALYRSLAATGSDFRLRVFCMDERTKVALERLALPSLVPIGLDELESHDPGLLAVKPTRTQVEYCWTATPAVCRYCLEREPELDAITYLDADVMFFRGPQEILDEAGDASVVIVPHRFPQHWKHWEESKGIYNVQYVTFRGDHNGLEALHWWRERCLEWCYNRLEDGKLGDQKYLDDWPTRFAGVHVLEHVGAGVAPWNVKQYQLTEEGGEVAVEGSSLIFFHYHSLRLYRPNRILRWFVTLPAGFHLAPDDIPLAWSSSFRVPRSERRLIWDPYLARVGQALRDVQSSEQGMPVPGVEPAWPKMLTTHALRQLLPSFVRRPLSLLTHEVRRLEFASTRVRGDMLQSTDLSDGWKSVSVAEQMAAGAARELLDPQQSPPYRAFLEGMNVLVADFALPTPVRFLDFGCGTGHYSELLARYFPGRFVYVGCDFSAEMVEAAQSLWPGRDFVRNDIYENCLDLGEFDVICASALVDVLPEVERALDLLLGSDAPHVLLHRQRVARRRTRVVVARAYRDQVSYRTYLSRGDLRQIAERNSRVVSHEFHVVNEVRSFLMSRVDPTC